MRKNIASIMICSLMLFASVTADAFEIYYDGAYHDYKGSVYSLYCNGNKINTPLEPIIFNNRALVPLREVFEACGATVLYNNATKEISVIGNGKNIGLQIGSNLAVVNGSVVTIPDGLTPKLISKRGGQAKTMVPVRFVSETIGLNVDFDEQAKAIKINTSQAPKIGTPIASANGNTSIVTIPLLSAISSFKYATTDGGVLYFDLQGFSFDGKSKYDFTLSSIKSVRFGVHENYTRVAVDMQNYGDYSAVLSADKKSIIVSVATKGANLAQTVQPNNPIVQPLQGQQAIQTPITNVTTAVIDVSEDVKKLKSYTPANGRKIVVVDAGHGGSDSGATGSMSGKQIKEKDINIAIAKLVQSKLQANGIEVMMTRSGDEFPSLVERAEFANKNDASVFVSIHANSSTASSATGIEVYYAESNNLALYNVTSETLAESVLKPLIRNTGAKNRGVKSEEYAVIRRSIMPAILVETGFVSNSEELGKLCDSAYQNKIADAIVEGIMANIGNISIPDRKVVVENRAAKEVGAENAKIYVEKEW